MFPPENVVETVNKIAVILKERNQTLATSESACGGLISSYLVSVPGASQYFVGGTLTYALRSRLKLSGWSSEDISSYTGPSEDVALRLARNLKLELGSTIALSETGWAGPTSSTDSKVGTMFLAISSPHKNIAVSKCTNMTDRSANMEEFARMALEYLLQFLENESA